MPEEEGKERIRFMKIEEIDRNFKIATVGDREIVYFNALEAPFRLEGFPWYPQHHRLYRLPARFTLQQVNQGELDLAQHTSGGAVRFRTDARQIAIRARLVFSFDMNHMPRTGSAGFDLFRGTGPEKFHIASAQPSRDQELLEMLLVADNDAGMQEWMLNLPLYGGVGALEIGVNPGSHLELPSPHAIPKPILFYGSSITQGGCASRPGNAYTSMLCREVDAEQINLGFSGSAREEFPLAEAIADLELSVFVMDYDHNTPNPEHLRKTHEPFFRIIREKQPELPIILMSKCDIWDYKNRKDDEERRSIIRDTYEHALAAGDRNVYFIDGETLFGTTRRSWCTVDTCHPNDLGFFRMFERTLPVLEEALKKYR